MKPVSKEEYLTHTFKFKTCKKCSARFICRGEDLTWIPYTGVKFDDQENMVNQNKTLSQRVCRPHGDDSCINPDKDVEGGSMWETQMETSPFNNFTD